MLHQRQNYNNISFADTVYNTSFSAENNNYMMINNYATPATNNGNSTVTNTSSGGSTNNSSSTAKGVIPVGTVLSIGGKIYIVIEGGLQLVGEGDEIPKSSSSGGNTTINITNINVININNTTNTYTYYGGDRIINNYNYGAVVKLLSDYQGIGLNGYSFYVNSSSSQLEIKDSRDKLIGYSGDDGKIVVYSYVASSGGIIDGRKKVNQILTPIQ